MTVYVTPPESASQYAVWEQGDHRIMVSRMSERDGRGAIGWSYSLQYAGRPNELGDRVGYHRTFARPDELIYTPRENTNPLEALETLGCFLTAWAEAQRYPASENRDLFPASVLDFVEVADDFYCEVSDLFNEDSCSECGYDYDDQEEGCDTCATLKR